MSFHTLFNNASEQMYVRNESDLRSHLGELIDHNILSLKNDTITVLISKDSIVQALQTLQ